MGAGDRSGESSGDNERAGERDSERDGESVTGELPPERVTGELLPERVEETCGRLSFLDWIFLPIFSMPSKVARLLRNDGIVGLSTLMRNDGIVGPSIGSVEMSTFASFVLRLWMASSCDS